MVLGTAAGWPMLVDTAAARQCSGVCPGRAAGRGVRGRWAGRVRGRQLRRLCALAVRTRSGDARARGATTRQRVERLRAAPRVPPTDPRGSRLHLDMYELRVGG